MDVFDKVIEGTLSCTKGYPIASVVKISNVIAKCQGCIYFLGVGKSGNMAKHCSDLLKSISIKSFFLDCNGLLHGDIGVIGSSDVVVIYSKSGATREVLDVVPHIRLRTQNIVGVFCETGASLASYCSQVVHLPFSGEVGGDISIIPTTSCTSQIIFSNILVSLLKDKVHITEYRANHPAGTIGENLKTIEDVLVTDIPKVLLADRMPLKDVLLSMTEKCFGCCFFVDSDEKLLGIITDGDIRRLLIENTTRQHLNANEVNTDFQYETNLQKTMAAICSKHTVLPVVNDGHLIGAIINVMSCR